MARCLGYFNKENTSQKITVLVATSGDTGGAVANGFLGVPGIEVVILYPKGKVSEVQEQQLTTLGQNITALEVDGVFDDCQDMVKNSISGQRTSPNTNNLLPPIQSTLPVGSPKCSIILSPIEHLRKRISHLLFRFPVAISGTFVLDLWHAKLACPSTISLPVPT